MSKVYFENKWRQNLEVFKTCIRDDGTIDYTSLDLDAQKRLCSWINVQKSCYEKRENNVDTQLTDERVRLLSEAKFNFKIEHQSTKKKTKKKMVVHSKKKTKKKMVVHSKNTICVAKIGKGGGDTGCKRVTKVSSKKRRSSSSKGGSCDNFFNLNVAIGQVIHSNSEGVRSQGGGRFRSTKSGMYDMYDMYDIYDMYILFELTLVIFYIRLIYGIGKTPTTKAVDKAAISSTEAAASTEATALTLRATPASRETEELKESTTPTPFTEGTGAPTPTPTPASRKMEEVKEHTNPTPSFTEGGMKPSSSSTFPLPQAVDSTPSATKKLKKQMSDEELLAWTLQNLKLLLLHHQTSILEQADANGCTPEFTQTMLQHNRLHAQGIIGIANRNKELLDKIEKKPQLKTPEE